MLTRHADVLWHWNSASAPPSPGSRAQPLPRSSRVDNMLKVAGDGRKVAVDMRLSQNPRSRSPFDLSFGYAYETRGVTTVAEKLESIDEFAILIDTGMKRVPRGAAAEFDTATSEKIRTRLDEFDAVRTRGDVESRSVHLGGNAPR